MKITKNSKARPDRRRKGKRPGPNYEVEQAARVSGTWPVAGIDEAGRGPWAGPVVAAAVILDPNCIPPGLDDSKVLDHARRERLFDELHASGAQIGIGIADAERIDRMNILQATLWAMSQAVDKLPVRPALVLVDGNRAPAIACACRTIIGGDGSCLSIAAASIIAKVARDRMMIELGEKLPGYGFERHKGYGTPEHAAAMARLGVSPQHRVSFKPVREALKS